MKIPVVLLAVILLSTPLFARESPGDIRRKWTRYVSSSRIKVGMQRAKAEQLLAAKLIAAKAINAEEILAYYELDPQYMVCVTYEVDSATVLRRPNLFLLSDHVRKNLTEWAAK